MDSPLWSEKKSLSNSSCRFGNLLLASPASRQVGPTKLKIAIKGLRNLFKPCFEMRSSESIGA